MDEKLLQDIGLTEGETKVYLTLLRLGLTKTGLLAKEAQVSSSKIYKILDRLEKKGLTGNIIQGKIKYFKALPPKTILNYMDDAEIILEKKRAEVEKMLPELERLTQKAGGTEAVIYFGFKAVKNLFNNLREILKPGEEYYVIGAKYQEDIPGLREFFYNHHLQRAKKKIHLKMLANYDARGKMEATTKKNSEILFLPQYLMTDMQIVFFRDIVYILLWNKEPIAFYIENEDIVKSFRTYFDAFWKIAKL